MLRIDLGKTGDQRYCIYLYGPADVKGTSFLVWKCPSKESGRRSYVLALKQVKRIAADDKRPSSAGSEFTYEDVAGRDVEDETHTFLREGDLGGHHRTK